MAAGDSKTWIRNQEVESTLLEDHHRLVSYTVNKKLTQQQTLSMLAIGLGGEVGEVLEPIKKHLYHEKELNKEALLDEVGDVLWYLHGICIEIDYSLVEALQCNIKKLTARYPEGFDASRK